MTNKRGNAESVRSHGPVAARTGLGAALWQGLVSPRFTLVLLVGVIFLCLLGTLFAQSGTSAVPLEKIYEPELLYFLRLSGLTDIFHSVWFIFVMTLLVLNQVCVLIDRFPAAWREAFSPTLAPLQADQVWKKTEGVVAAQMSAKIPREVFREVVLAWCKGKMAMPKAVRDEGGLSELQLSAKEGRFSQASGLLVPLGGIILVIGGMIEGLGGFEGQVTLEEGARVNYIQVLHGSSQKWPVLVENGREMAGFHEPGFEIELVRFKPEFYSEGGALKGMKSWINFIQKGATVATRQVAVGVPAVFNGIRFFQAHYAPTAQSKVSLVIRENYGESAEEASQETPRYDGLYRGQKYDLEGASFRLEEIQNSPEMGISAEIEYSPEEGPAERFWIFQKHPHYDDVHRKKSRYHFSFPSQGEAVEPRYTSSLRVSRNPGLGWIFAGALLATFGFLGSALFGSHRYWFVWKSGKIRVFGGSQRPVLFVPEFEQSVEQFRTALMQADQSNEVGEIEVHHG